MRDRAERRGEAYLYTVDFNGIGDIIGVFAGENQNNYGELGLVSDLYSAAGQVWVGLGSIWGRGTYDQGGAVYVGHFTP